MTNDSVKVVSYNMSEKDTSSLAQEIMKIGSDVPSVHADIQT